MKILMLCNFLTFAILFIIWSKRTWANVLIKFGLGCLALGNLIGTLLLFGFIVQQ